MSETEIVDDLREAARARAACQRKLPESTYRVQFHAGFTFRDAAAIVPYLAELGVTHLYASPYLRARPGSTHGYDVIDHCRLNPELGTDADFAALLDALRSHGLSHILDTVPNHVGVATNDNAWWNDVLLNGRASRYAKFFDITWDGSPRESDRGKLLLPVLGEPYGEVLEKGQLQVGADGGGLWVSYYDRRFPLNLGGFQGDQGDGAAADDLAEHVRRLNGTPGDPASFDALDELLGKQHYRLAYWRTAPDEINYRRFFDINDLAALAVEHREVFEETHALTLRLAGEGKLTGLRVDHPDGLYDPEHYFRRLQRHYLLACAKAAYDADARFHAVKWEDCRPALLERLGRSESDATATAGKPTEGWPLYVVAEKILAGDEALPQSWAVHGTSGYDFLNQINGLFVDGSHADEFSRLYADVTGETSAFADVAYAKKKLVLENALASELRMLATQLDRLAAADRRARDFTLRGLTVALRAVIACFPVYRSYIDDKVGVREADRHVIEAAVAAAAGRNPEIEPAIFHFIRDTLLTASVEKAEGDADAHSHAARLRFAGKFQQLTAPVTAKGVEDTAFYVYHRLISLNEVGGEPARFGVEPAELHCYLLYRQRHWPYALSALSTHDTKRSEDVRARLNVLSEMPTEWAAQVSRLREAAGPLRPQVNGKPAPDANDEYLLYQTLVGAWPWEPYTPEPEAELPNAEFGKRVAAYMEKAMREAKVHTTWTDPNAEYENAVKIFVTFLLDPKRGAAFLAAFRPFQRRVSERGLVNSLSQTVLRLAAPGVPDTYQGTEFLDDSLVDPDNRRPVDYAARRKVLAELSTRHAAGGEGRLSLVRELAGNLADGRAKFYVLWRMLQLRREHPGLFSAGEYVPLEATGEKRDCVFAFVRRYEGKVAVVVVPRLVGRLGAALPLGSGAWGDTQLTIPSLSARSRWTNVFTDEIMNAGEGNAIPLARLLGLFPAAVLMATT